MINTQEVIIQAEKDLRNYIKRIYPEMHEQLSEIIFRWKSSDANHKKNGI